MEELKVIIGENLAALRKEKKMTQAELAEKFNYTDKAISKWEKGETSPDIETLYALCEFYGVTIDYLTHPGNKEDKEEYVVKDANFINKVWQTALTVSIMWMVATIIFIWLLMIHSYIYWQAFIWAIPVSAIALNLMNHRYFHNRLLYFISWSIFIWGVLAGFFFQFISEGLWPLFILGAPAEVTLYLWYRMNRNK